jgi:hypothetical protein
MTTNNRAIALVLAVLASSAVCGTAHATLMQAATFDEKVENANAIVYGKVVKQEARWDAEHRWILTYTTIRVEKSLKGVTPPEVTIVTPGGNVGDVHQDTVGIPDFAVGSETAVFVRNTKVGPTVLYFDQGAYDIGKDTRGNRMVMPVETDSVRIDTQRGVAVTPEEPRTLGEFETAVRESGRRTLQKNQMAVLKERRAREPKPSIWTDIADNAWIVAIAVLGAVLASVPLFKRLD